MPKKKISSNPDAFEGKESELHRLIEDELKRRRWFYIHSRTDKRTTQQAGVPDFVIASPVVMNCGFPKTYWIEVKKKGNKLSEEQTITQHILKALGHHFAVVYSMDDFMKETA